MLAFTCPTCLASYDVPESRVGQLEKCPQCKAIVEIRKAARPPAPAATVAPAAARPAVVAPVPAVRHPAGRTRGIALVLELVGLLIAAIGVLGAILSAFLMVSAGPESEPVGMAGFYFGGIAFLIGLLFSGLGSAVAELTKIRRLLEAQGK